MAQTAVESSSTMEQAVPSITLSITHDDVKRVIDASKAVKESLVQLQNQSSETSSGDVPVVKLADKPAENGQRSSLKPTKSSESKAGNRPLHEMIFEAAKSCEHPLLSTFLEKMKTNGASSKEIRAGVLLFHEMEMPAKIKLIFAVLGDKLSGRDATNSSEKENFEQSLARDGTLSLFRSIINAVSSCIHQDSVVQLDLEKEENEDRPRKKMKMDHGISPRSTGDDSLPTLKSTPSPSFDSSFATMKDEEESAANKEFEEIAIYATDRVMEFAKKQNKDKPVTSITVDLLQGWYKAEGSDIVPWMDLLSLSMWQPPPRPTEKPLEIEEEKKNDASPLHKPKEETPADISPPRPTEKPLEIEEEKKNDGSPLRKPKEDTPADLSPPRPTEKPLEIEIEKKNDGSPLQKPKEETPADLSPPRPTERPLEMIEKEKKNDGSPLHKPKEETPADLSPLLDAPSPSFPSPVNGNDSSRTVVSFDFTGSMPDTKPADVFCINITEDNLRTLRNMVEATGLSTRPTRDLCDILMEASKRVEVDGEVFKTMPIERFQISLSELLGGSSKRLSKQDTDVFSSCFVDFFSCFDRKNEPLTSGEADGKELAVGFCFLCAGNKSSKLISGFESLEAKKSEGLTADQLAQYLRSYLTMLVGISLLTSSPAAIMKPKLSTSRRQAMFAAVDHGAKWTLSHFLKTIGKAESDTKGEKFTFETFATWYTNGGYNVAPWLELLDLSKLLSLVTEMEDGVKSPVFKSPPVARESLPIFPTSKPFESKYHSPRQHSPRQHSPRRSRYGAPVDPFAPPPPPPPAAEVLFTFPLANQRSLVVLREDATYVRGVVEQLGLLMRPPDDVWKSLFGFGLKRPPLAPNHGAKPPPKSSLTKSMLVNKAMFVECMQSTISAGSSSKKRSAGGISKAAAGAREILANFFHSFDLHQIDRVALNELMGGLTLLCGGKKSTKLAFAFGVFDHRIQPKQKKGKTAAPVVNSLGGEDLFLFLRSFLIVMFSCCRQSWDLSDDAVGRYIADTANMVTDDVMRYQWRTRKRDRVDFDEFGEWYNEGGFETAPWLELLDLKKWVLNEDAQKVATPRPPPKSPSTPGLPPLSSSRSQSQDYDCPPPPPEDSLDPSFFVDDPDDDNGIMPMDSIDEMDIILMQSHDHDDSHEKLSRSFSYTQSPKQSRAPPPPSVNSLKFHLVTDDDHGGYMVSVSQKRIRHLRHILIDSGLHRIDGETACKQILGKSFQAGKSSRHSSLSLTKDDFNAAMRGIVSGSSMSLETQRTLSEVLGGIFSAFDHNRDGTVNAVEVACGFTVLCQGKKSDKLEYAFEVLDRDKRGKLSKSDTARYLRSFLTVLLNIASTPSLDSDLHEDSMSTMSGAQCDRSAATQSRAVEAGSSWASGQAFKGRRKDLICFDEFAEWYTHVGYSNIPWLELLDLHKWVVMD